MKTQKNLLYRGYDLVCVLLLLFLSYCTYCSFFNINGNMGNTLKPSILMFGTIIYVLVLIRTYRLLYNLNAALLNRISLCLFAIFGLILLIFSFNLLSIPTTDLSNIHREALTMLSNGGKFEYESYFAMYPNNIACTILIFYVFKLASLFGFTNYRLIGTLFNATMMLLAILFVYYIVLTLKNKQAAIISIIIAILNPAYYIFVSNYYTDTLSMPFVTGAILLFIKSHSSNNKIYQSIGYIFTAFLFLFATKIRATSIILLIGIICICILKDHYKKLLLMLAFFLLGFILASGISKTIESAHGAPDNKNLEFPVTHWIMMGLYTDNNGGWNQADWNLTHSQSTYDAKIDTNLEVINERIRTLGVPGLTSLMKGKMNKVWSDGTYVYNMHMGISEKYGFLYDYTTGSKQIFFLYFLQFAKCSVLLLVLFAVIHELFKKQDIKGNILIISLFGCFLFYFLWEAQRKYSLSFLPWMTILMTYSVVEINNLLTLKSIQMKFSHNNRTYECNEEKLRKFATNSLSFILFVTIILFVVNFNKYTIDTKEYRDLRAHQTQANGPGSIDTLTSEVKQTFTTDLPFNTIAIKFTNTRPDLINSYIFEVHDENGNTLHHSTFTSDQIDNNAYKTFSFDSIKPSKTTTYSFVLKATEAVSESNIGVYGYQLSNYDMYPTGTLYVDQTDSKSDLTFDVLYTTTRPYTSKNVYLLLAITSILVESWILLSFYKRKN